MNKSLLRFLLSGIIVFFHVDHICAQNTNYEDELAKGITAKELKEHLTILAGDDYEGRETGQPGQKKAAQYLADYYTSLGVSPIVNGSWFQQFPLKKTSNLKTYATSGDHKYDMIKDFYTFSAETSKFGGDEFVFAGFGIAEGSYDDYKGLDVRNKTVMCLMGEPINSKGVSMITKSKDLSDWTMDYDKKRMLASSKGASCLIMVNQAYDESINRIRYWLEQAPMRLDNPLHPEEEDGIPVFFISPSMADDLLSQAKKTTLKLQKKISKKGSSKGFVVHRELIFHMEREEEKMTAENVLCFIEGSDPILKKEVVVISAHYDHIGIVNGQINNGADDDGSGTVSAMELAEAFVEAKKSGHGAKRSILVLNVSGEEKGLLGSEWYSDFPVFPLDNTVCDLNIDMIGRKDEKHTDGNYVYLIGSDKLSTELHSISEKNNKMHTKLALDYTYNDPNDPNRFYYRSDHYNFAKHNIPVIFYFSGVHADYHKPGDDVEKIMFDKMATIAKLVFYTAWEVANRDEKLKVDVLNDFEQDEH
jgi:hypothetical protein